ncbi:sugar kinase [Ahrensia kielensis]|uniref:Sugar kinase n=1 Tax=Ahrensia kielensis TaxID=76980 RepID=A0ABU9T7Y8_9HYPH
MISFENVKDIRCAGEAMVELSVDADGHSARIGIAGDVLNSAIYLKRTIADKANVSFVSRVGDDKFSMRLKSVVEARNINANLIGTDKTRTVGLYAINTDAQGERTFQYWRSQSAARIMFGTVDAPDFSSLDGADLIYLSAITVAILTPTIRSALLQRLAELRSNGVLVGFDSNFRPALWESPEVARAVVSDFWKLTDIGFPSIDDEMALFDEDAATTTKRLTSYNMPICILKRGDKGPIVISGAEALGDANFMPAENVVDTTGAGDSFNGTFLGALLSGCSIHEACHKAHAMASRVVGFRGAIID